ncbi:metal-dependent hydrolase [Salinibaculum rarum]|uniref:metal-dependent hydrolase n=1 Tax=Salinibaculum rarum TaxID=3058903 RepID=UPI0026604CAF|nr:metal-dependent hydrolase [Salinibaculum sp. KK48]
MAGTIVHMAFAGLIAAALLGEAVDRRALAVVLGVTAIPDLDSFIALVSTAGHRTVLHNFVIPAVAGVLLWVDLRREESWLRARWGPRGVRIAWVSVVAYAAAGVGLDMVSGYVNPLYPLHDQFYELEGKLVLSDQRGIVQTFLETGGDAGSIPSPEPQGSSQEVNLSTGVDPDPSGQETDPERIFPVVRAGWQLVVLLTGTAVTLARLRVSHSLSEE